MLFCLPAQGQSVAPLSQQRINEFAAYLGRAERAVLEAPKLRGPNETLTAYCKRLLLPLPNETEARQKARIQGYLAALEQAAKQTEAARKPPPLCDASAANEAHWKAASASIAALPRCLRTLQADAKKSGGKTLYASFAADLTDTLYALHAAREAMRDARP